MNHPLPWLRFVDAQELNRDLIDFKGLNVESPTGEHLGEIEGFVVDAESARPYYVVVESGGWFKSKHFLLPIGHARLDADREVLVSDLTRDRVEKFPGFDKAEFDQLSEADIKRFNDDTCRACSIEGVAVVYAADEPVTAAWQRSAYAYPNWWAAEPSRPDRMGAAAITTGSEPGFTGRAARPAQATETRHRADRELVTAREREADSSPHPDGRAQPGDVIGVETGGERTYVGDTANDENRRRKAAEEVTRKNRPSS